MSQESEDAISERIPSRLKGKRRATDADEHQEDTPQDVQDNFLKPDASPSGDPLRSGTTTAVSSASPSPAIRVVPLHDADASSPPDISDGASTPPVPVPVHRSWGGTVRLTSLLTLNDRIEL